MAALSVNFEQVFILGAEARGNMGPRSQHKKWLLIPRDRLFVIYNVLGNTLYYYTYG